MLFSEVVIVLLIAVFLIFVVSPAIRKVSQDKETPLTGEFGDLENTVNKAADLKKKAAQVTQEAKNKVQETLHKVEKLDEQI